MDIFWKKNCSNELKLPQNADYDVQVSSHLDDSPLFSIIYGEVNIGFFYIRSTIASIMMYNNMMQNVSQHYELMGTYRTWDQKLFDRFLRFPVKHGEALPAWNDRFLNVGSFLNSSYTLNVRRLPSNYSHNIPGYDTIIKSKLQYHENTMFVHISWGIDHPKFRIHCAYKLGPLNDASYRPPDRNNICFEIFDEHGIYVMEI